MFETLEVGKRIKNSDFKERELPLRQKLLAVQFELAEHDYPIIIVVAGLDGAGKGSLVHRLNEWMDPQGIETNTYWEHSDEEESRPFFWRFWRRLPARGQIGIFLGSWYTKPTQAAVDEEMGSEDFALHCKQIEVFERMLSDDGTLIIKLWLHVSQDAQRLQLEETAPGKQQNPRVTDTPYNLHGKYKKVIEVCEELILDTDSSHSPWHLIEAQDRHYRDITAGEIILKAMQARASHQTPDAGAQEVIETDPAGPQPTVLDNVDLSKTLDRDDYKIKLAKYQSRLQDLAWQAYRQKRSVVAVFEGWDAAGKGSAIRRVTRAIDPRLYRLIQFAAPTDEEQAHHYLWRFWRQLERDGRCTFFDRSWYGRVLVERVEQFATEDEWQRAYSEINQFEQQLVEHGSIVLKFWIHISKDEQIQRFKAREQEAHKRHKITDSDWRNRGKWHDYEVAIDQMISHTSTRHAPWALISGNDKPYARIQILKTFCKSMKRALDTE
ncbi:MAG: polyphosphate:AMP phosphotransferase [Gammaproteobacteria bacterium]|nr:MAG: polyphosphate:AMP phosphotransferase [Gammaproteobacteria bacterium]